MPTGWPGCARHIQIMIGGQKTLRVDMLIGNERAPVGGQQHGNIIRPVPQHPALRARLLLRQQGTDCGRLVARRHNVKKAPALCQPKVEFFSVSPNISVSVVRGGASPCHINGSLASRAAARVASAWVSPVAAAICSISMSQKHIMALRIFFGARRAPGQFSRARQLCPATRQCS